LVESFTAEGVGAEGLGEITSGVADGLGGAEVVKMIVIAVGSGIGSFDATYQAIAEVDVLGTIGTFDFIERVGVVGCFSAGHFFDSLASVIVLEDCRYPTDR
jgi:hypothetical protein